MVTLKRSDLPEFDEVVTDRIIGDDEAKKIVICALRKDKSVFFVVAKEESLTQRDIIKYTSLASGKGWQINSGRPIHADLSLIAQLNVANRKTDGQSNDNQPEPSEVTAMFHYICKNAVEQKASDIFIEHRPEAEGDNLIKMRINGLVETIQSIPSSMAGALVAVSYNAIADDSSKVADHSSFVRTAILNAAINIQTEDLTARLRAVYMPAFKNGSDLILRVLPEESSGKPPSLEELGYTGKQSEIINRMAAKTSGVLIFSGIAGSGKSTTIRSLLDSLQRRYSGKRIAMIEDPIEYKNEGINQIPLADIRTKDRDTKQAWAEAVKGLVRANVDIMALGEVRDDVTAGEMVDYILTGHQVLTTLHAPSAIGNVQRLERLGISRDIIAGPDFVSGFVYQRLLPRLCQDCSTPINSDSNIGNSLHNRLSKILDFSEAKLRLRHEEGCDYCRKGYTGRVVAAETMLLDNTMREFIKEGKDSKAFNHWRSHGLRGGILGHGTTALEHAQHLMERGIVSPIDVEAAFGYIDMQNIESDDVIDQAELP